MKKFFKKLTLIILVLSSICLNVNSEENKIKVGLLIPMTGDNKELGESIIKSVRMAVKDINSSKLEIFPRDSGSNPEQTLKSAIELKKIGIDIVIGPVFYKSLAYLEKIESITFLSLTNKTIGLPKNVISSGINATSQLNTIKKFVELSELKKTIFLTPQLDYEKEIKKGIKQSKLKISKHHIYDTEPTILTEQIEKITNYKRRKQNLADEIQRIEESDLEETNKERRIEKLKKKYTLGNLNFDSIIISDFNESLKSVVTSLLYTDVLPKDKYIITFNQWFDQSLINEKNLQPIYYPSINKKNLEDFKNKFRNEYKKQPNHLMLLSYDLVGLVYYLSIKNNISQIDTLFKKKNSFKGKIGIFDIQNNKINHRLSFYQIDNGELKKIF